MLVQTGRMRMYADGTLGLLTVIDHSKFKKLQKKAKLKGSSKKIKTPTCDDNDFGHTSTREL